MADIYVENGATAVGTDGDDRFIITSETGSATIDAGTKGLDTLYFDIPVSVAFYGIDNSKDLRIHCWLYDGSGNQSDIIIKNYFTSTKRTESKSSLKNIYYVTSKGEEKSGLIGYDEGFQIRNIYTVNPKKQTITGTDFSDIISASTYDGPFTIDGGKGNDRISGSKGNDKINGGAGNDYLNGGSGNDVLTGGKGHNTYDIRYKAGTDKIVFTKDEVADIEISRWEEHDYDNLAYTLDGKGNAVISYGEGEYATSAILKDFGKNDLAQSVTLIKNGADETVDLKAQQWTINPTKDYSGSYLNELIDATGLTKPSKTVKKNGVKTKYGLTLAGGAGVDKIYGSSFNDTIKGGAGDDNLRGLDGDDTIKGGAGNDIIRGGAGNDTITGGTGKNDIYHYLGDGNDVINLTKGENVVIHMEDSLDKTVILDKANVKYKYTNNNKDLKIYYEQDGLKGSVTLKNFAAEDVLNNATKKTADTSSIIMYFRGTNSVDLKTLLVDSKVATWRSDNIDKSDYKLYTNKKKTKVQTDVTKTGLTIDGKGGNDVITGTNYSDTIKAGTGIDRLIGGTGNDKLYGGTTTDSQTTYVFNAGDGKDTIYSGKGIETVEFSGTDFDKLTYTESGTNLIIGYNLDNEGKAQDTVKIKNYFDNNGNVISAVKNLTCNQGTYDIEILRSIYHEEGKYLINEATDGNDNIISTNTSSLNVGNGDDTIYLGGGNDNTPITIGHGKKTVITPDGFDKTIRIFADEYLDKQYYKYGDDLVIKYANEGRENDSFTIKDYFTGNRNVNLYINSTQHASYDVSYNYVIIEGEGLIEGRLGKSDIIYGSDKADTIYVTNYDKVYPGEGNDTLIWKQNRIENNIPTTGGQQEVYLQNGDGNNTYIFEAKPGSYWQLHFDEDTTLKYERKDNDLLIHSTYNDGTKDITETQTIKDWAVSELAGGRILTYRGELAGRYYATYRDNNPNGILRVYTDNEALNLTMYASDDNDVLSIRGTNIRAYGYDGDDEYRGYAPQKKATVIDSDGNDSLIMYDETLGKLNDNMDNRQLHLMFNVDKDYKATQGAAAVGDVIVTGDASKENYDLWQADGEFKGISIKNNAIETIKTSDAKPYTITNDAIATLAENVAGWLATNDYADVSAVFAKPDNEADITALIAQFDNANWTA